MPPTSPPRLRAVRCRRRPLAEQHDLRDHRARRIGQVNDPVLAFGLHRGYPPVAWQTGQEPIQARLELRAADRLGQHCPYRQPTTSYRRRFPRVYPSARELLAHPRRRAWRTPMLSPMPQPSLPRHAICCWQHPELARKRTFVGEDQHLRLSHGPFPEFGLTGGLCPPDPPENRASRVFRAQRSQSSESDGGDHHPKTEVVEPEVGRAPDADGAASEPAIIEEGPAPQHPKNLVGCFEVFPL